MKTRPLSVVGRASFVIHGLGGGARRAGRPGMND